MKLQVLLSAMHLNNYRYINSLNITTDCVVINQCDSNEVISKVDDGRRITYIATTERGLSRSRNMAIENASAEICIFCDNDVEYLPNYESRVLREFEAHPQYDVIVFFVKKNRPGSRPYFRRVKKMGYYSTLKVFSPEIAFRLDSLKEKNIRFNPEFGAGAKYSMGEENIFLYECLKKGLRILYVPEQVACLREEESTWFHGFTEKFFRDRGAVFYEMSNRLCVPFIFQFAIRKFHLYRNEMPMRQAIRCMLEGKDQYRQTKN